MYEIPIESEEDLVARLSSAQVKFTICQLFLRKIANPFFAVLPNAWTLMVTVLNNYFNHISLNFLLSLNIFVSLASYNITFGALCVLISTVHSLIKIICLDVYYTPLDFSLNCNKHVVNTKMETSCNFETKCI